MGLDINVYRQLTMVSAPQVDEDGYLELATSEWTPGGSMEWSEKHFPGRGEGLEAHAVYTWGDQFGFRAGSYSGYNRWRQFLQNFSRMVDEEGNTFIELINFADNEGVIGPVVSLKLAKDFMEHEKAAEFFAKTISEGEYWYDKYQNWKEAFIWASDNGAVEFC